MGQRQLHLVSSISLDSQKLREFFVIIFFVRCIMKRRERRGAEVTRLLSIIGLVVFSYSSSATAQSFEASAQWVGRGSCSAATCHGGVTDSNAVWHSSSTVWEALDPHAHAGLRLQDELARRIVLALDPAAEVDRQRFEETLRKRCVSCHAPEFDRHQTEVDLSRQLRRGVGCEACHGAAGKWLTAHTARDFNPSSQAAQSLGMKDTQTLSSRVEICASCHIGSREANELARDVNHDIIAAGHPRMLFDPLVMERKLPVHWDTSAGAAMAYAPDKLPEVQRQARSVVLDSLARLKAARKASTDPCPAPSSPSLNVVLAIARSLLIEVEHDYCSAQSEATRTRRLSRRRGPAQRGPCLECSAQPCSRPRLLLSAFSHGTAAKVCVKICNDMACHLRGSVDMAQRLKAWADEQFEGDVDVKQVSCLGRCDRPPASLINEQLFVARSESEFKQAIAQTMRGEECQFDTDEAWLQSRNPAWQIDVYGPLARDYGFLRSYVANPRPQWVIESLERAGLLGMGGAGGRTYLKWQDVRQARGTNKSIICNGDESEPGTFKDRDLMLRVPHLIIEGMALAGLVVGAHRGFIFIRHEYAEQAAALNEEIRRARGLNALGNSLFGSSFYFDLEVVVSPGNYIAGEQTALVEALEGNRAEPRIRPRS